MAIKDRHIEGTHLTTASCCSASSQTWAERHPLDPLEGDEMARAARIVAAAFGKDRVIHFERLEIEEPEKSALRMWKQGDNWDRRVRFSIYAAGRLGVTEGILSLDDGRIVSSRHLPTARPMIMLEEFVNIEKAVKAHPDFISACRRRGIEDIDMVCVDPWSAGSFGLSGEEGYRISHTFSSLRTRKDDNYYAHPIEGLNAVVDIASMTVLRVDDHFAGRDPLPVPLAESQYDSRFFDRFAPGGKPLDVIQPEGPSFTVNGRHVSWMGFDVRVGFNSREGLVLHEVGYSLDGRRRPIIHRASLAEMVVPYGSPEFAHYHKNVFDIGEYGLGKLANSLKLGCDCLGAIHYMDAWVNGIDGTPVKIENAICIHEEDQGIGWKHWDWRTDVTEVALF